MTAVLRAGAWADFYPLARELGGDPEAILKAAGVAPGRLARADAYLPMSDLVATLEAGARILKRPDFGLLWGAAYKPASLGAVSIAMLNAPSPREGLRIAGRFLHIHAPAMCVATAPAPPGRRDMVEVHYNIRPELQTPLLFERAVAGLNSTLAQVCGPAYRPLEIRFRHAPGLPMATYVRVLGVEPVFGAPHMGIVLSRDLLDAPLEGYSDQLRKVAEAYLASLAQPRGGLAMTVSSLVRTFLQTGACSASQVARALGMHERTLQRRLKDLGESFENIKDASRRDLAADLLARPEQPISEIALNLGYSDPSAFSRSCRRWFGAAPGKVREELQDRARPKPARRSGPRRRTREG